MRPFFYSLINAIQTCLNVSLTFVISCFLTSTGFSDWVNSRPSRPASSRISWTVKPITFPKSFGDTSPILLITLLIRLTVT
ncbi:hypothetical protein CJ20_151 [Escherichia phage CJ20]|nr:hypothetical protein CJ20_151 [Escherichia phage CJ20]